MARVGLPGTGDVSAVLTEAGMGDDDRGVSSLIRMLVGCAVAALVGLYLVYSMNDKRWEWGLLPIAVVLFCFFLALSLLSQRALRTGDRHASLIGFLVVVAVVGSGWYADSRARSEASFKASLPAYTAPAPQFSGQGGLREVVTSFGAQYFPSPMRLQLTLYPPKSQTDAYEPSWQVWFIREGHAASATPDVVVSGRNVSADFETGDNTPYYDVRFPKRRADYWFPEYNGGGGFEAGTLAIPLDLPNGSYNVAVESNGRWFLAIVEANPLYQVKYNGKWVDVGD